MLKEYVFAGKNMAEIAAPTNPTKMAAILKKLAESEVDVFFKSTAGSPTKWICFNLPIRWMDHLPSLWGCCNVWKNWIQTANKKKSFRFSNKKRLQKKGPHLSKTQIYCIHVLFDHNWSNCHLSKTHPLNETLPNRCTPKEALQWFSLEKTHRF